MAELAADDPQWIGGYRLLRRLGSGGMGRVYLARSEGGRTVAVKHIKAELAAEPEFRERFRLEVEAARRVGERWTAPVLDADTEADTPWVATGYIAGPSLDQVVSGEHHGPLPEESVRTLAYGLAGALSDIHRAGIVHRDLKPSNVLITIDGPRVIDFGIARALDAVPESTMTHTGVVVGSPSYMSPEQVRSARLTPASDVFCMGSVLAYAATGCPPFGNGGGSGGMHSVMFRIAAEEPDLDGVGEPLRSLIEGCLVKDPEKRFTPADVITRARPEGASNAAAPWLPAPLIAELGRRAVQLLDTDTPPSGSGARPDVGGADAGDADGPGTARGEEPAPEPAPESGSTPAPASDATPTPTTTSVPPLTVGAPADPGTDAGTGPTETGRRSGRRRAWLGAGAALLALAAAGAGLFVSGLVPGFGGETGGGAGPGEPPSASDVPASYVGTWSGPVERDGEPTGQYRRFELSEGRKGEIVANSVSLGRSYMCKSDGTLVSAEGGLKLDTKVVKSVPEDFCSALGSHSLTRTGSSATLDWEAAGRRATLHRVRGEEQPAPALRGTWTRPLANGGTQRLTIESSARAGSSRGVRMVSEGPGQHCEAGVDLFSAGRGNGPVRIAPPDVDSRTSSGSCTTGHSSTLRLSDGVLLRHFPDTGATLRYTRAG
ncbi:serine/threonine-protein kinase [Streptomyces sp. HNM0574]|uniref:serine/threonine-protein kinase n=1 Tax=Streptomyces sp. HNM0574 TaxID=2714954 RepID=UPI00146BEEE3|nr:serine/threonine-protein kinase [Streptomyces sp. HNM0574]NLU68521.1 serine/threonine protein kinase [Streptomyces sp. HNM0574]